MGMEFVYEQDICGKTCFTYYNNDYCKRNPEELATGCVCQQGLLYDEVTADCVVPQDCSCLMDPVDSNGDGIFEFTKNVTDDEEKYFETCYTESDETFGCTA